MPSQGFVSEVFAQESGDVLVALLTLEHADLVGPMRFANQIKAVSSRGNAFEAFPFLLTLPNQGEAARGVMRLEIDNVDQRIAQTLRSLTSAPLVTVELVLASDPDTVEMAFPQFELVSASWGVASVSGDLAVRDDDDEPSIAWVFNPASAPALF